MSRPKVNPYSVIDISPESPPLLVSPANGNDGDAHDVSSSPVVPSGYLVPVPCGYATPSNVPIITPTYTTPVIIRHLSVDEEGKKNRFFLFYYVHIPFVFTDLLVKSSLDKKNKNGTL